MQAPRDLITYQRPSHLTPSPWGLGFQHINLERHRYLVYSITLLWWWNFKMYSDFFPQPVSMQWKVFTVNFDQVFFVHIIKLMRLFTKWSHRSLDSKASLHISGKHLLFTSGIASLLQPFLLGWNIWVFWTNSLFCPISLRNKKLHMLLSSNIPAKKLLLGHQKNHHAFLHRKIHPDFSDDPVFL